MNRRRLFNNFYGYLLVLPSYAIFFLFILIPCLMTVIISFTNYDLYKTMDFIGLDNYKRIILDDVFIISIRNTVVYTLFTIFPNLALGLLAAVFLSSRIFGRSFFRAAFYIPYIPSMISVSMVWLWMFDPSNGILNKIMQVLKLPQQKWLFDMDLALPCLIVIGIWKSIGYNMILYIAGIKEIPKYLYEASKIDGASSVKTFFLITLPMLRPITFFLLVTGMVSSFNVFDQVNVLTEGGPINATTTIVHQIYSRTFLTYEAGYGSAMTIVLMIIVLILTLLNFKHGSQGIDRGFV